MPTLTFDEPTHRYTIDGKPLPSVTQVLHVSGLVDTSFRDEDGLKRGSYVHAACQFEDEGDLAYETLDPALQKYVEAWRKAKAEMGLSIAHSGIEERVYHPLYHYAGTIDRLVVRGGVRFVVDIKTGQPEPYHPIQLAAYAMTYTEERLQRANVYIGGDGSYRWVEHTDRKDYDVWKACLTVYHFRSEKGLVK